MGRSAFLGLLVALVWGAGALACAAWAWQGASPARLAAGLAASASAGAWAARWWWRQPDGWLSWDGSGWTWSPGEGQPADGVGQLDAVLDLQSALLLRWSGPGPTTWFWAERRRLPARWAAMRRAVYSRADADALPGAEPPSARP
ncbi:hypothetical protein [Ramlibacter sp.]|uniref:hypothetical protein n=1 Tax=Ramlibacter sp. TaxID=1917967 RepID=UPI002D5EF9D4|nr:hypothetical protein [Ramlibacter sp.]HYD74830.1 hypothetical protein [Ramlibacter sp.]